MHEVLQYCLKNCCQQSISFFPKYTLKLGFQEFMEREKRHGIQILNTDSEIDEFGFWLLLHSQVLPCHILFPLTVSDLAKVGISSTVRAAAVPPEAPWVASPLSWTVGWDIPGTHSQIFLIWWPQPAPHFRKHFYGTSPPETRPVDIPHPSAYFSAWAGRQSVGTLARGLIGKLSQKSEFQNAWDTVPLLNHQ